MLSDMPDTNVFYLTGKREDVTVGTYRRDKKTFGSNIHTLFLDSFFLEQEGTIGAFAEEKINQVAAKLFTDQSRDTNKNDTRWDDRDTKILQMIGDDLIQNRLVSQYNLRNEREDSLTYHKVTYEQVDAIDETIALLERQIEEMQNTVDRLKNSRRR